MAETDAMDFYKSVTDDTVNTVEYTLENEDNRELTVHLHPVDRKKLLNELAKLPPELLSTSEEIDVEDANSVDDIDIDEEEAEDLVDTDDPMGGVDGDVAEAFEELCKDSIKHEDLTEHHISAIVDNLSIGVLFEIGSEVIRLSFDEDGSIKDFHKPDSDKSS